MADTIIPVTPGVGADVAFSSLGGALGNAQVVKLDVGTDGNTSALVRGQTTMANSLPVTIASNQGVIAISGALTDAQLRATAVPISGTFWQGTQPVSGPLTDAQLRATAVPISGTFWQATQPVSGPLTDVQLRAVAVPISVAALPLPSGAATAAKQPALGTAGVASADVISVQGIASMTPLAVSGTLTIQDGGGSITVDGPLTDTELRATAVPVSGTFWQATQPISGTVTIVDGAGSITVDGPVTDAQLRATAVTVTGAGGVFPVTGTFWQGTQPVSGPLTDAQLRATAVSIADGGGSITVDGPLTDAQLRATAVPVSGSFATTGQTAHDAVVTGDPVRIGAYAKAAAPTDVSADGDAVNLWADLAGRLAVWDGGLSVTVDGTFWQATQPVSGTFWQATQPVSGTFWQATQPVSGPLTDAQLRATPVPISGTVTANAGTNLNTSALALEAGGNLAAAVTALQIIDNIVAGSEAQVDVVAALPAGTNLIGDVGLGVRATGGMTIHRIISAASNNAANIKASAGRLYSITAMNINAAVRYLKFYNKASSPTVGTDTPVLTIPIPGNAAGAGFVWNNEIGWAFATGISVAIVTGVADADNTSTAANEQVVNLGYA